MNTLAVYEGNYVKNLPGFNAMEVLMSEYDDENMDHVVANGKHHLLNRRSTLTTAAMDGAARNGHITTVQFLHENRKEGCTTAAVDGAATFGHHEIVRWLLFNRKEGCTQNALNMAAKNDDTQMLGLLLDTPHSIDIAIRYAIQFRCKEAYEYLIYKGACKNCALIFAAKYNYEDVVEELCQQVDNEYREIAANISRKLKFDYVTSIISTENEKT